MSIGCEVLFWSLLLEVVVFVAGGGGCHHRAGTVGAALSTVQRVLSR